MATFIPNAFTSYKLTDKEAVDGAIFTSLQLYVLQNRLAELAQQKLNIEFDPSKPEIFVQEESYKRGQLEEIQSLIEISRVTAEEKANPTEEY